MAAPVPLHADRGDGRTYTAADRCRSGETSTHGGLTDGHLKLHSDLHRLDGRDLFFRFGARRAARTARLRVCVGAKPAQHVPPAHWLLSNPEADLPRRTGNYRFRRWETK